MQLGKTLVGAIIGAALGIGLLYGVNRAFHREDVWMAIPVALLTGLGVRLMVSTSGHASYLRGAITVLFALGAFLGGWTLVAEVAKHQAASASEPSPPKTPADDVAGEPGDAKDKAEEPGAEPPAAVPQAVPQPAPRPEARRAQLPRQFSTWDFISLAVAALVAYELGRGTGGAPRGFVDSRPSGPVPGGTHPDA